MKKSLFFLLLGFFLLVSSEMIYAAKKTLKYIAADISPELRGKAKAVVRVDETTFTIQSIGRATKKVKYAVTIFKKNGDDFSTFVEFYDKNRSLNNIKICIYNGSGELIKKVRDIEIKDLSAISGYTLYADNRRKYFKPVINSYPYTIEYEFEVDYKGLMDYPNWQPINSFELSVDESSYKIITPLNFEFRYKELNLDEKVKKTSDAKSDTYFWSVSKFKALERKSFSPKLWVYTPMVYAVPNNFRFEGYVGNMQNWKSFGNWIYGLNLGLDKLPPETIEKLKNLIANDTSTIEKVRKVYQYMQNKTRYVSIQLGIGGYQPFPASVVDEVGYGDCKALSNYMFAMLKSLEIKSFYTIVKAGSNKKIKKDFPSNQFNHAILCVPIEKDTIFLECTSQSIPFGFLGNFTDDRDVLLITEDGGKIAHTTVYSEEDNTQFCKAVVRLDEKGKGEAKIVTNYSGLQYDDLRLFINTSRENQKKKINKSLGLSNFEILDFDFSEEKSRMPTAEMNLELRLNKYASVSGKRLFVPLNLLNRSSFIPENKDERKIDISIRLAYHDADTIVYTIPDNYKIEYKPEDVNLLTEFGEYSASTKILNDTVIYTRNKKMHKGQYSPDKYQELVKFYKKMVKADKAKLVLIKKIANQ